MCGAINVKKIELQNYTGTSKEEFLVAVKELWGAVNTNNLLPSTYPPGVAASRSGGTWKSLAISQVNFLKVKRPVAPKIELSDS